MARGRMLNKSIALSDKFAALPDDTCRLLATWTISFLDHHGVFYADPLIVRSQVAPLIGITEQKVSECIQAMAKAGLIVLFEQGGRKWQYWPGFAENQVGLRITRERSEFPNPPTGEQKGPTEAPKTQSEPPEQEQPESEENCSYVNRNVAATSPQPCGLNERKGKEIVASATNVSISDSTQPKAENPITRTDDMAQHGNSHDLFFISQRSPAENLVRSWQLPTHLEDLSLEFVRTTGVTPKGGDKRSDKGLYAADAKDWINAGYTAQDFQEAYQRCNGKFPITHLGALFRDVQENKRHAQPKADDDSANMVYTPSGKRVMAQ